MILQSNKKNKLYLIQNFNFMDHEEIENSLNENGLNEGDKCQITLLNETILEVEFIQYVSWIEPYSTKSHYIKAKIRENKQPYIIGADGKVEYWQENVKDLSIPIEKIKSIKYL